MSSNYGAKVHIKETFPWREMFHAYAENYQTYFFLYSFFLKLTTCESHDVLEVLYVVSCNCYAVIIN